MDEPLPIALDLPGRNGPDPAEVSPAPGVTPTVSDMTTFALPPTEPLLDVAPQDDADLPRSVANPRRTTWTGFAKADVDRLPAT